MPEVQTKQITPVQPTSKHAGGRPTKLNCKLIEEICQTLRGGNYIETACDLAGITRSTWAKWLKDGSRLEDDDPDTLDEMGTLSRKFSMAVKRAMAESESEDLKSIRNDKQWTAKAWRLERMHPDRYGQRVSSKTETKIEVLVTHQILPPIETKVIEHED